MMLSSSAPAELAVPQTLPRPIPVPSCLSGFQPDLAAVYRQLSGEFPEIPAEQVRSVLISGLTSLDAISRGSLPEILYRLAGQRLRTQVTRIALESGPGEGSRPPPIPHQWCPTGDRFAAAADAL